MKRPLLIILGIIIYLSFFSGMIYAMNHNKVMLEEAHFEWIEIEHGDTLWAIAKRYHREKGISIQEMLYNIYYVNNIDSPIIYPGQKIKIPL